MRLVLSQPSKEMLRHGPTIEDFHRMRDVSSPAFEGRQTQHLLGRPSLMRSSAMNNAPSAATVSDWADHVAATPLIWYGSQSEMVVGSLEGEIGTRRALYGTHCSLKMSGMLCVRSSLRVLLVWVPAGLLISLTRSARIKMPRRKGCRGDPLTFSR